MNYYVNKMREIEAKYNKKYERIISDMKVEVEKAQMLREDLKIDQLNFLSEEAKKEVKEIKEKYFEECKKILEENMPIPKATNYTELDLKLMKLNMLASKDKENMENLKNILNPQDFNIYKGQLLEIALLKNSGDLMNKLSNIETSKNGFSGEDISLEFNLKKTNSDKLISEISNLEVLTEEDFKGECRGIVGSQILNNDFVPGVEIGYQALLKTEGLNNHIDRLAGIAKVGDLFSPLGLVDNEIDFVSQKTNNKAPANKVVDDNLFNSLGFVDNQSNFESKEYSEVPKKEATGEFFN